MQRSMYECCTISSFLSRADDGWTSLSSLCRRLIGCPEEAEKRSIVVPADAPHADALDATHGLQMALDDDEQAIDLYALAMQPL